MDDAGRRKEQYEGHAIGGDHMESAHHRNTYDSLGSTTTHHTEQQHITTVAHVGFSDALIAQKPRPFTKTMFKLYFFLLVAFMNSCINGYDGSLMSGINAMDQYQK
jgi:hypothetical protein